MLWKFFLNLSQSNDWKGRQFSFFNRVMLDLHEISLPSRIVFSSKSSSSSILVSKNFSGNEITTSSFLEKIIAPQHNASKLQSSSFSIHPLLSFFFSLHSLSSSSSYIPLPSARRRGMKRLTSICKIDQVGEREAGEKREKKGCNNVLLLLWPLNDYYWFRSFSSSEYFQQSANC